MIIKTLMLPFLAVIAFFVVAYVIRMKRAFWNKKYLLFIVPVGLAAILLSGMASPAKLLLFTLVAVLAAFAYALIKV